MVLLFDILFENYDQESGFNFVCPGRGKYTFSKLYAQ